MLTGKKYPQCVRALCLPAEELLCPNLQDERISSHDIIQEYLKEKSEKSRTTKLINSLFLALQFIRAEREGDWPLHLDTVESMLPLFYAAGHQNYARDGLYYLKVMQNLPENAQDHFLRGEQTVQHKPGVLSGI